MSEMHYCDSCPECDCGFLCSAYCEECGCHYQEPHRHGFACDKTCEACGGK